MTLQRKKLLPVFIALLILWTGFIFSNSLEDGKTSMDKSLSIIEKVDAAMTDTEESTIHYQVLFRKMAHFIEFFILGLLWYAVLERKKYGAVLALGCSVLTAFADEGLQMLNDRGNSLEDVFLDSAGAAAAVLFCVLVLFLLRKVSPRKKMHPAC